MRSRRLIANAVAAGLLATLALNSCSSDWSVASTQSIGDAKGDWRADAPGVRHRVDVASLPRPYATDSVDNGPRIVPRPEGALPKAPDGFRVSLFATGLDNPRVITAAPNGDIFVVESRANRVRVLRDADNDGKPEVSEVFASGLREPFGLAFYPLGPDPKFVYVANTDSVVRFPYRNGDLKPSAASEVIVPDLSGGGRLRGGGHWTRDVAFSNDGSKMYVSVGSRSNVSDDAEEERRARIFEFKPDGTGERVFAWGIRNPVGLAVHPDSGDLWTTCNERDGLGDDLVPDYITRVREGGFYGWPWFYLGKYEDPRHTGKRKELRDQVVVPDVLLQAHSAALDMIFYAAGQFPAEYRGHAFAALHGSWNRAKRTGYKVIRVPVSDGKPSGDYEDFLTGFVVSDGNVWGRPVGVTVAKDGSLMVSDDGSDSIWKVSYAGK
jgi:glucose/arabinose dehydrogenase